MNDFPRTFPDVKPGAGAEFWGAEQLNCGHDTSLDCPADVTIIVAFCHRSGSGTGANPGIISKRDNGWGLIWYTRNYPDLFHIRLYQSDSSSVNSAEFRIPVSVYCQLALVASSDENEVRIYANAEALTSFAYDGTIRTGINDFTVGAQGIESMNGTIRQVVYFDCALAPADVVDIHYGRVDPLQAWPDNLKLALDLTQAPQRVGNEWIWPDLSGNKNHATMHGNVGFGSGASRRVIA